MKILSINLKPLLLLLAIAILSACQREAPDDDAKPQALVSGTLEISQEAQRARDPLSVLFIMLRKPEGGMVAAKKILPPFQFPLAFRIEEGDLMIAGTDPGQKFKVTARLDQDGDANPTQKGDILGESEPELVSKGSEKVRIVLDKVVK